MQFNGIFNTIENTKNNTGAKLEEQRKSDDPWTVERRRAELKRYMAVQEAGGISFNLNRKSDSSKRKSNSSNDWKKYQKLEHFHLMKKTIITGLRSRPLK